MSSGAVLYDNQLTWQLLRFRTDRSTKHLLYCFTSAVEHGQRAVCLQRVDMVRNTPPRSVCQKRQPLLIGNAHLSAIFHSISECTRWDGFVPVFSFAGRLVRRFTYTFGRSFQWSCGAGCAVLLFTQRVPIGCDAIKECSAKSAYFHASIDVCWKRFNDKSAASAVSLRH